MHSRVEIPCKNRHGLSGAMDAFRQCRVVRRTVHEEAETIGFRDLPAISVRTHYSRHNKSFAVSLPSSVCLNPHSFGIESGIVVANTSSAAATVRFELFGMDGKAAAGISSTLVGIPASGQMTKFLTDLFPSLPKPFKGGLRISTSSSMLAVAGLRTRYNERNEFLITTTPPVDEDLPSSSAPRLFPHLANGDGYSTQFILFSGAADQTSSGTLRVLSLNGQPLEALIP